MVREPVASAVRPAAEAQGSSASATKLVAHARFALADAHSIVPRVCEHLAEHAATLSRRGGAYVVDFGRGTGFLEPHERELSLRAEAADLTALHHVRLALAAHIVEFAAPRQPEIVWSGDGAKLSAPPNFRIIELVASAEVTPHMRRLIFKGEALQPFVTDENLHVGLLFPPADEEEPSWPTLGRDGLLRWSDPARRPVRRKYTIRSHDPAAGTIAIDFVAHANAGPASGWATRARPGLRIGMTGPGGLGIRPAGWYLLAGDETALPAIGRILESLPGDARGTALVEIADAAEEQALAAPPGVELRWLHRNGAPAGTGGLLPDAVRRIDFPQDGSAVFAWAAAEFETFKVLRAHLRQERGLEKHQHLVVAYWRRGHSEDEMERARA